MQLLHGCNPSRRLRCGDPGVRARQLGPTRRPDDRRTMGLASIPWLRHGVLADAPETSASSPQDDPHDLASKSTLLTMTLGRLTDGFPLREAMERPPIRALSKSMRAARGSTA